MNLQAPTQVILAGDATGKAGQRAAAGKSDYAILTEILSQGGLRFENRTPEANPPVKDRINTVNAKLCGADGQRHLFVNPKGCPNLVRDLQRVVWKPGGSFILDQTTNSDLTHISDAMGYVVCSLSKMWAAPIGKMGIIRR